MRVGLDIIPPHVWIIWLLLKYLIFHSSLLLPVPHPPESQGTRMDVGCDAIHLKLISIFYLPPALPTHPIFLPQINVTIHPICSNSAAVMVKVSLTKLLWATMTGTRGCVRKSYDCAVIVNCSTSANIEYTCCFKASSVY